MEGGAGASGEPSHAPLLESTRPPYDVEEGRQGGEESTCWAWARKIHRNPDNDIVNTNFTTSNVFVRTLAPGASAGVGAPAHGMCTRLGARSAHGSAVCGTLHEIKNADTNFGRQNSLEAV